MTRHQLLAPNNVARRSPFPQTGLRLTSHGDYSYFGLLRQATHSHVDRARLANALRERGHAVNGTLTKTYRRAST